jgi:3-oxoadipate enol-lactonase
MRFRLSSGRAIGYSTRGSGQPVLLLHPVGLDREFWDDVVAMLSAHCRILAPDLPGHGESDVGPHAQSLSEMALDVAELIDAVGQPPVVVVGCSLGGMAAQALALERPDLINGLVLANTSHDRDAASRAVLEKRAEKALVGMSAISADTLERWFDPSYAAAHPDRVERVRAKLEAADPVVHAWTWRAIAALDHGERLRNIKVPALRIVRSPARRPWPWSRLSPRSAMSNSTDPDISRLTNGPRTSPTLS